MSGSSIVELRNLAVGYNRRAILSGVHLQLARGAFSGLLGANGSGKTTLLKTMAGILRPLSGEIAFQPPANLGYVPQRDQLDAVFIFSAFEVALMGVCGRVGPAQRIGRAEREWVHACLARAGAESFARERFGELSGGQRQRVLIARALAARPDFLLLDEPTAGIDAAATHAIMELLARLNREQHLTILMVNHDVAAMRRNARDIIWIYDGKLMQGPAAEMLRPERIEELLQLQFA